MTKKKRKIPRKITVKIEESLQVLIRRLKSKSDILCLVTKKVTSCDKEAVRLLLYFRKFICDIRVGKLNKINKNKRRRNMKKKYIFT